MPAKAGSKVARVMPCAAASCHKPERNVSNDTMDWPRAGPITSASASAAIGKAHGSIVVSAVKTAFIGYFAIERGPVAAATAHACVRRRSSCIQEHLRREYIEM